MTFLRTSRRLGQLTDFPGAAGYNNPDGTPTYDGAPYDPPDAFNPYNGGMGGAPIASSGQQGNIIAIDPRRAPPLGVQATGLPAVTSSTATDITGFLTALGPLIQPNRPLPLAPAGGVLAPRPPSVADGASNRTLLLLAATAVAAVVLLKRKRP